MQRLSFPRHYSKGAQPVPKTDDTVTFPVNTTVRGEKRRIFIEINDGILHAPRADEGRRKMLRGFPERKYKLFYFLGELKYTLGTCTMMEQTFSTFSLPSST